MKVSSLLLYLTYQIIDKDGKIIELSAGLVTGCRETSWEIEKYYGVKLAPTTVWRGKIFKPTKFKYHDSEASLLAWANWSLNCGKEDKAEFFDNEIDQKKWFNDNPYVDVKMRVSKNHR